MEMDFDELEWLQSNQQQQQIEEEDLDLDFYYQNLDHEQQQQNTTSPVNKRPRSNGPDSSIISPDKRPKINADSPLDSTNNVLEGSGRRVVVNDNDEVDADLVLDLKRNILEGSRSRVINEDDDDEDWIRPSSVDASVDSSTVQSKKVLEGSGSRAINNEAWNVDECWTSSVDDAVNREKLVSRFAFEIDGDCVPITGIEGERVYAKLKGVEAVDGVGRRFDFKRDSYNGLISEPIHALLQRVETEAFTKAIQASVESESDATLPETPAVSEKLWVDKYSPSSFMELLSDEQTNREVLLWLKHWDSCVFGSEIRATGDDVLSSLRHHSSVAQKHKFSNKRFSGKYGESRPGTESFKGNHYSDEENNDPKGIAKLGNMNIKGSGSSEHKILLLCGPPGLGKTTLAHVAAKHCGYRVVEINASDDRSSSSIEGKILDVVQMNSVMADSKPKCLVIDEIDGALGDGKGAVEVILKMLSAEKKSATGKENSNDDQKKSSKKKHKAASLSRPVICICNDLYAPALRPLRQVAQVHVFVQPTVTRVVNRLKYICNKEGLKTSSIALTALAEYTECDIRACLNTLQFLHKKKESLNVLEIDSQVVGRKDTLKSVFDIWKEIFQKRKEKNARKLEKVGSSKFKDFDFMHSLVSNRGDYDLILDGVHENILQLHYHDPGMQKTVKCLHSLGVSDLVHQYIMRTQKMSLLVYQPTTVVYIRSLVAQNQRPNIEWPKSFHRSRTMLTEKTEDFRSWHKNIPPHISRHISTKSLVEDSVSPLLHILSPPRLRPVAVHLLSEKEKNDIVQLVNTMVAYSVTYKHLKPNPVYNQPRSEAVGDNSMLTFDPPLANLINFKGYTSGHFALAAAVKQMLVHEVEKQKILQSSINRSIEAIDLGGPGKFAEGGGKISIPPSSSSRLNTQNSNVSSNMSQSKSHDYLAPSVPGSSLMTKASSEVGSPGEAKKRTKSHVNFFERFRKLGSSSSQQANNAAKKPATLERDSRPLLFKFNEGYTNAVKRPVRIREFL